MRLTQSVVPHYNDNRKGSTDENGQPRRFYNLKITVKVEEGGYFFYVFSYGIPKAKTTHTKRNNC